MILRTGISIIIGGSTALGLALLLVRWQKSRAAAQADDTSARGGRSFDRSRSARVASSGARVQVLPPVEADHALDVDGGLSARPRERWFDRIETYDAANPDDLGADYLARAVQVPRESDETEELDVTALHVDVLGEDALPDEAEWRVESEAGPTSSELRSDGVVSQRHRNEAGPAAGLRKR